MEEAIVAKVGPSEKSKIDESLKMEFINVTFQVTRSSEDKRQLFARLSSHNRIGLPNFVICAL
jgi:hypothetical protein